MFDSSGLKRTTRHEHEGAAGGSRRFMNSGYS
jgi:hypothetical protein